ELLPHLAGVLGPLWQAEELVEWCGVDDHSVVEVRPVGELGDAEQLVAEVVQLSQKRRQLLNARKEAAGVAPASTGVGIASFAQLTVDIPDLGSNVPIDYREKRVRCKTLIIKPHGVRARGG